MTFASLSTVWGLTGQWRPRLDETMLEPNDVVHILPPDFLVYCLGQIALPPFHTIKSG